MRKTILSLLLFLPLCVFADYDSWTKVTIVMLDGSKFTVEAYHTNIVFYHRRHYTDSSKVAFAPSLRNACHEWTISDCYTFNWGYSDGKEDFKKVTDALDAHNIGYEYQCEDNEYELCIYIPEGNIQKVTCP